MKYVLSYRTYKECMIILNMSLWITVSGKLQRELNLFIYYTGASFPFI